MSQSDRELVASIRHELAAVVPERPCCRAAELDALGDSGRRVDVAVARTVHRLSGDGLPRGQVSAPRERAVERATKVSAVRAPRHCRIAFLRGRVLARGSLSFASGRAHLELVLTQREANLLAGLLAAEGLGGMQRVRRGRGVIVWKGRSAIFDLLRRLGAGSSVAEIEARGVLREVRGELNRRVNADTANLQRTVRAGMRQAEAIRRLREDGELHGGELTRRVASARLAHPEATIGELGESLSVTRSRVQRALSELERAAAALPGRRALP